MTDNGYYRVALQRKDGTSRYYSIHRIVAIEFNYNDNYKNLQIDHLDGDKSNNGLPNLDWCSGSENIQRAYNLGIKTQKHGEDCSYATITNKQAEEIAQLLMSKKYTHKQISEITRVKLHIIDNISTGTTWIDVFNKYNLKEYQRQRSDYKFSDEDLHKLCKYFEDNKNKKYRYTTDLFRDALHDLFNIEYIQTMSATLSRIYNHETRKNITDQYDY